MHFVSSGMRRSRKGRRKKEEGRRQNEEVWGAQKGRRKGINSRRAKFHLGLEDRTAGAARGRAEKILS
jgi:hypothetical protein